MSEQIFPPEVPEIGQTVRITVLEGFDKGSVLETTISSRLIPKDGKEDGKRIVYSFSCSFLDYVDLSYYISEKCWELARVFKRKVDHRKVSVEILN